MAIKSKKNQKMMVVMISILLAFFLWLYVMGEKNPILPKFISDVPVTLINTDAIPHSNLALVPEQEFITDLKVTGRAFDISKITASDIKVEADMNIGLLKGNNRIPIKISYNQKGVTVTQKSGLLYIVVKLDNLAEKTVPILVNVRGNVKEGYGYTKPLVRPSEVKISGPADYVGKVFSAAGEIMISGNYTNISGSISLYPQDKNGNRINYLNISPKYVDATVSIKPSKEVPIKVNTYGVVGNGKVLRSIKSTLNRIVIIGDTKYINKINEINTTALDLSKITESSTLQLALNMPMGVNTIDGIESINVELLVENKVEKTIELPITVNDKSNDYNYNLSAQTVTIKLDGPESIISALNDRSLYASISVNGFTEGNYSLPITVNQIDGIETKSLNPDKVEVEVMKK